MIGDHRALVFRRDAFHPIALPSLNDKAVSGLVWSQHNAMPRRSFLLPSLETCEASDAVVNGK